MIPFATGSSKTTNLLSPPPPRSAATWLIRSLWSGSDLIAACKKRLRASLFLLYPYGHSRRVVRFRRAAASYRYKSLNSNVGMSVQAYSPSGAMMTCSRMVSRFSPIRCGLRLTALSCSSSYGIRLSMFRTRKSFEKYAVRTWHVRMWVMRFWTPLIRTPICGGEMC